MRSMLLAGRLAWRELRGGLAGLGVFLLCLVLGVGAVAAVGSLAAAVDAGLAGDSRALLGGDVAFRLVHREASPAEHAWLVRRGTVSEVADMRAMAIAAHGGRRSLIELKSVDHAYPLYGAVTLAPALTLDQALAFRDGHWGAVVAPSLLDRLGLEPGDAIRIGNAVLVVRARLMHEPDNLGGIIAIGPRVIVSQAALAATGLITPGVLVDYTYRVKLAPGRSAAAVAAAARTAFPDAGWRIRAFTDAAPNLKELLDRLGMFMTLVGLAALLVGGVGIANAVRYYLAARAGTIATLKALGASRRLVFATYLVEIVALALVGIAGGLVLGALAPVAARPFLPTALPVTARVGIYAAPLAAAFGFGLLATLAFALSPIAQAVEIAPARLFRASIEPTSRRPGAAILAAIAAAAILLALLAVMTAPDKRIAAWAVVGAAATLAIFRLAAAGIVQASRHGGRPRHVRLRMALANLHRPGAATAGVLASLGLGLALLVAIVLVERSIASEIDVTLPARAPTFFFIDIQPGEVASFNVLLKSLPGVTADGEVPSLRGRITRINGAPVERARIAADAKWAIRGDRGLTYAAHLPKGSRIVAGTWWPADYHGPPLVSFDAALARGMGLKLGDTLTVNVLGRELTARIASLRTIDWTSLGINFAIVLSPGALDGAPRTYIAAARAEPGRATGLERAVTDRFPNVSAISVRDALQSLATLIDTIAAALSLVAALALAAGVVVLGGAVAAGHRRRVYESIVLKVLGAARSDVTLVFLIEYGLLGVAAAALAALVGTLAAWLLLTRVMHVQFTFAVLPVLATLVGATTLALAAGYAGTWRALGAKAAPFLRND